MNSEKTAKSLLDAQSESKVASIIQRIESEESIEWVPHGNERNYNAVYGNTPNPAGAFAELPMNSIDAILIKRYCEVYDTDSYHPAHGLTTVEKAVEHLWESEAVDGGIEVIADGPAEEGSATQRPNLIVRDTGGGQPPEHFKERFLDLSTGTQHKDDWPFTQGRFKMGAGAALRFSGERGYKLILSAGFNNEERWSWSIIRNNDEKGHFEFLRIKGVGVPTFEGQVRGQKSGTFVKVYEYKYGPSRDKTATILTQDYLRDRVDRVLINPAIPIRYNESRNLSAEVSTMTSQGLVGQLDYTRDRRTEAVKLIDRSFDWEFGDEIGTLPVRLVVFKNDRQIEAHNEKYDPSRSDIFGVRARDRRKEYFVAHSRHREQAVFYTVNGQTHATERRTFLTGSRHCELSNVGSDMIAIVDLSEFGAKQHHNRGVFLKLFTPSRDRLSEEKEARELRSGLEEAIDACDPIQNEEERRRMENAKKSTNEASKQTLRDIVSQDRSLIDFLTGEGLEVELPPGEEILTAEPYSAGFYPTRLEIIETEHRDGSVELWDESQGKFKKEHQIRDSADGPPPKVKFDLDAPDDYFTRSKNPGTLLADGGSVETHPTIRGGPQLSRGVMTLNLKAPTDAKPGDVESVEVKVTREVGQDLSKNFLVEYTEPDEPPETADGFVDKDVPEKLNRSNVPELPNPIQVYRDEWENYSPPWTPDEAVRVHPYEDDMDILVNMDHQSVTNYKDQHDLRPSGKEIMESKWTAGIALNAITMFKTLEDSDENFGGLPPETVVGEAMKGVARPLLSLSINDIDPDTLTH